jgi:hypothetical protein
LGVDTKNKVQRTKHKPDIQNLAGHAREFRVTRKVNLADRSAGYQCHSIFLNPS